MKSTVILAVLLAGVLLSPSTLPASAAANTGGMSAHDKETCRLLERNFNMSVKIAGRRTGLERTNNLEDAMNDLNEARRLGCPWAKTATIPW